MEKINKICLIVVFGIICFIIGYCIADNNNSKIDYNNVTLPDTTYNKVTLDSIEYNIIKKDSIIYNIKQKMKYEVTKVLELDDSSAVKLFEQLCAEP